AAELCVLLVDDIYGQVSSKVVAVLFQQGRLPLPHICRHAKLPEKTVKQTLVVLIQQHLVLHFTHLENGREETYYECDWKQAYGLVRTGRIIRLMEDRFGNDGATIASNLLQLGHARVGDFLAAYGISTSKAKGKPSKNAKTAPLPAPDQSVIEADAPITSVEDLKTVMADMLRGRFLVEVQQHHMHPRTDLENGVRAELTKQLRGNFSSELKLNKEVSAQVRKRLGEMFESDPGENAGMKRKAEPAGGRAKKRKKVSMYDDEEETVEWEINEEIVIRINHEKFLVLFRNTELAALAERRLGKVTSQVYAEFLKLLESKIHRCRHEFDDEDEEDEENGNAKKRLKISTLELSRNFPRDIELEGSIAEPLKEPKSKKSRKRSYDDSDEEMVPKKNGKGKSNSKKHDSSDESDQSEEESEEDEWAEDTDMDPDARMKKKRLQTIKQHLQLLAEDSFKFLRNEGNRGAGEWSVNYKELGKRMRGLELEKVVDERFESVGTRLLRIIKDKGKLDEKQIATIALLKQNQIRAILSGLHEAGHLELQEVPKSLPPQVSRTYFLWYFDEDRANSLLLADTYKAMSRNMQRTAVEKQKRKQLIEKSERSDVQANYEEYLSKNEKSELEIWRSREERLMVQLMRLDRVVMILRDF
ncbi:RNA polymerase III subunit RPC82-domain-containing protein, partial [Geopyxis carbonaria]